MRSEPYNIDEMRFAWCYRVYYRLRTHRRQPKPSLVQLDFETLRDLLEPVGIHLLELASDAIGLRLLVSLQPSETVSAAASKMKGRISKWLGAQSRQSTPSKSLARGYFAATTGQPTADAVEEYLQQQGEHHGYSDRARPPLFVQSFARTPEAEQVLRTDHAVTSLRYHVVMATWQRQGVFVRSSAETICHRWQSLRSGLRMFIDKVSFVPDHAHVALALHPSASPAATVVSMMNVAQELMWERFDNAVVKAGTRRLWQPSAYIGSFGDLTSNAVSSYVRQWERESGKPTGFA